MLNGPPPGGVSISIDPTSTALFAGQTIQFTASVAGTSNAAVTWSLDQPFGTVSTSGMYSAPAIVSVQQATTVRATSLADPTKSAAATIVISPDPTVVPMVGPVNPDSGAGSAQLFQFTAHPRSGELEWVQIVINGGVSATNACYIAYYPGTIDQIALSGDDSTGENNTWAGIQTLGQPGTLSNSQCTINVGASSAVKTGTAVQINLSITFKPAFHGTQQIFMAAQDAGGNLVAWPYVGYWVIP